MRNFKFLQSNNNDIFTWDTVDTPGFQDSTITINTQDVNQITTTNVSSEFCFRFNESDPVVFATSSGTLSFTLSDISSDITFSDNNNTFTLFSRRNENI
jgi:hypothetical protein